MSWGRGEKQQPESFLNFFLFFGHGARHFTKEVLTFYYYCFPASVAGFTAQVLKYIIVHGLKVHRHQSLARILDVISTMFLGPVCGDLLLFSHKSICGQLIT